MTYMSEVAISISHQIRLKILKTARTKLTVEDNETLQDLLKGKNADHFFENEHGILVHYKSIKWYPFYPEIRFVDEFLDNDLYRRECLFVRIGDEYDDLEYHGCFDKVRALQIDSTIGIRDVLTSQEVST